MFFCADGGFFLSFSFLFFFGRETVGPSRGKGVVVSRTWMARVFQLFVVKFLISVVNSQVWKDEGGSTDLLLGDRMLTGPCEIERNDQ